MFQAKGFKKLAGAAILIPDKIVFKTNLIRIERNTLHAHQRKKNLPIQNICAPNTGALKFIKENSTADKITRRPSHSDRVTPVAHSP